MLTYSRNAWRSASLRLSRPGGLTHMQHYELLLLLNAQAADTALEGVLTNVRALLAKVGATITKDDPLGKRRLAYAIKKQAQGAYHLFEFDAPPQAIQEIDRLDAVRGKSQVIRIEE